MVEVAHVPQARVPTGIVGLDTILRGGLIRRSLVSICGAPGTGKTVLASQLCFHHVHTGGRAVFVTLLAESHTSLLTNLTGFSFYTPDVVGDALYFVSGYNELATGGLDGLAGWLRELIRERRATLLVMDGLTTVDAIATDALAYKRFLYELQATAAMLGTTTVLIASLEDREVQRGAAMMDALIEISRVSVGLRSVRRVEVQKLRGSDYLEGQHLAEITRDGLAVYPRTEAFLAVPSAGHPLGEERQRFGIPRLDEMLAGGVPAASTTLVLGIPGTGKTTLGLHFLAAGAQAGEPGLYFGFYEQPAQLLKKAEAVGIALGRAVDAGLVELLWQSPVEQLEDALAERLLAAVRARAVRRLVMDSYSAMLAAAAYPARLARLFAVLLNELRSTGVTTLMTAEAHNLFGAEFEIPLTAEPDLTDTLILLRYVELRSQLYRLLSILKMRDSAYDAAIREFTITEHGIEVAASFASAEAVLSGLARPDHRAAPGSARGAK